MRKTTHEEYNEILRISGISIGAEAEELNKKIHQDLILEDVLMGPWQESFEDGGNDARLWHTKNQNKATALDREYYMETSALICKFYRGLANIFAPRFLKLKFYHLERSCFWESLVFTKQRGQAALEAQGAETIDKIIKRRKPGKEDVCKIINMMEEQEEDLKDYPFARNNNISRYFREGALDRIRKYKPGQENWC